MEGQARSLKGTQGLTKVSVETIAFDLEQAINEHDGAVGPALQMLIARGLIRPGAGKLNGEPVELVPLPADLVAGAEEGKWKIVVGWVEPGEIGVDVDPGLVDACSILEDAIDAYFATRPGEGDPLEGEKILRDGVAKAAEAKRS